MKAIIGKKVGMSQIFDENGHVIPVTVIEAGPCVVVQKKTAEKDGYEAVQLGFEDIAERKLNKPELGHLNKAGVAPKKHLKEFSLENAAELNVGDIVKADTFAAGDFVDVTGTSKGHGFQGVVKRHGAAVKPRPPPSGLPGRGHDPGPHHEGPRRRGPHGRGPGHRSEPLRGQGGPRAEHAGGLRRGARPQGRAGDDQVHRQGPQGQAGRRGHQQEPAEGFRPQPAEGLRQKQVRKGC